jgi:hypothetical protein
VSEAGALVDYYLFYGPSIDRIIALYRIATGAAPMPPKWALGLFHSKDAYGSQNELLAGNHGSAVYSHNANNIIQVSYSLCWNNSGGDFAGLLNPADPGWVHNLFVDPQFMDGAISFPSTSF